MTNASTKYTNDILGEISNARDRQRQKGFTPAKLEIMTCRFQDLTQATQLRVLKD